MSLWQNNSTWIFSWYPRWSISWNLARNQSFSLSLVSPVITFCDQTLRKVVEEVQKTEAELHTKLDRNELEEIISSLEKSDGLDRKIATTKKNKFNYLKFKPKNHPRLEDNEEIIHTEKTNEHHKPSYAAVLKRKM